MIKQVIYEHPSGVFLHVQYQPRTADTKSVIEDVRLAGVSYEPIGPNLMKFLDSIHTVDTSGPIKMATPMLELMAGELP